tara:strand:+ start:61 stop:249 length:189 start_codon:yes stop_codon:yes gene_type:complete
MALSTIAAAALAVLLLPVLLIWRLSLTPQQNARRLHRRGHSYRAIGRRLGCAHTTARRYCLP